MSASNAVLADGRSIPGAVGNGTVLAGSSVTELKTAAATAGDLTQMQVKVNMVGTVVGVAPSDVPMPSTINLANDGFICGNSSSGNNETHVCCTSDPNYKTKIITDEKFLPRQNGDLTIMYDVIKAYDSNYLAEVTISNDNPLGRLDSWKLSWNWTNDEFIHTMKGAHPSIIDSSNCVFGSQGEFYKELDFANVLSCEKRPTIMDLPPTWFNDTQIGKIPFCCRNGTLLPPYMDPSMSISRFQMQVYKMPPYLNRSNLTPPQNWEIKSSIINPNYKCGGPIRVSPSQFQNPTGLPSNISSIASWQVVCNITKSLKSDSPKCCVSFSAFYNESVIPCNTCACGCHSNQKRTCSLSKPAMWLPSKALLVPFENRSEMAHDWASMQKLQVPNPVPCGDNCGVSINWHVNTDYEKGWTARITIFNWGETNFVDWFAAVQMDKGAIGLEEMYSFNGGLLERLNTTIFMQGKKGLNFLVAEANGSNPRKDPRVPGKQQSVISFRKEKNYEINMVGGDGFPRKVFFNGEECSLPSVFPSNGLRNELSVYTIMILILLSIILMQQW